MSTLLTDAGRALYGDQWQSALARDLGVSDRTVRRWVAGDIAMPPGVPSDLLALVQMRQTAFPDLIRQLEEAANRQ